MATTEGLTLKQRALATEGVLAARRLVVDLYEARTWAERCTASGITFDTTVLEADSQLAHLTGTDLEAFRAVISWLWVQLEANAASSKKQLEKLLRD